MEKAVAIFVIINFVIIGTSHLMQGDAWKEFFAMLQSKGRAGALANGFLSLSMGSIIVACHSVWNGIPVVLTLIGWAYLLKAAIVFLFPDWGIRSMASVQDAKPVKFMMAGIGMIGIALLLGVGVWQGNYSI